jgi:8-oxo-dGTP diphosphatase
MVGVQSPLAAVAILLVNRQGEILLQLRDAHAPVCPNVWGTVGGAVEAGERPDQAAARELFEETGISDQPLTVWWAGELPRNAGPGTVTWHVYTACVDLSSEDIVVGEGADICFVPPQDILALTLAPSARSLLTRFLAERPD